MFFFRLTYCYIYVITRRKLNGERTRGKIFAPVVVKKRFLGHHQKFEKVPLKSPQTRIRPMNSDDFEQRGKEFCKLFETFDDVPEISS